MTTLITPDSPWRSAGDTTVAGLRAEFQTQRNSPLVGIEADLIAEAGGYSRLMAAISWAEAKHDTYPGQIPKDYHNFLSLSIEMVAGTHLWEQFDTYVDCVRAWRARLTDADRPYFAAKTVAEFMAGYTPARDNVTLTNYAATICSIINRMPLAAAKGTSVATSLPTKLNMTKGLIPYPLVTVRLANKVENVGVNALGKRMDRGDCWHRGLTGRSVFGNAVDWLNAPTTRGQTDYYIDHITGAMVRMLRFGFADDWTPWAQGPWDWSAASPDAIAFMNLYEAKRSIGVSVWNSDLKSLEIDGDDEWISPACKRTMIEYSAAHWHDLGVHHDQAPVGPDGITVMFSHREGCGVDYKKCAFSVVWDYINSDEFLGSVRDRMEAYQTGIAVPIVKPDLGDVPIPVKYAPLQVPDWINRTDKAWIDAGGTRFLLVTDQYRAIRATPRLQYGYPDSPRVGPDVKPGEDAQINFVFEADGEVYGLSYFGTRFLLKDFERVSDSPAKAA